MKNNPSDRIVMLFIDDHVKKNGYPPSRTEIANELGVVLNSANYYVDKMCRQGLLVKQAHKNRAIKITNKGKREIAKWRK